RGGDLARDDPALDLGEQVLAICIESIEAVFGLPDRPITGHGRGDITQFGADLLLGPCTGASGMLKISHAERPSVDAPGRGLRSDPFLLGKAVRLQRTLDVHQQTSTNYQEERARAHRGWIGSRRIVLI